MSLMPNQSWAALLAVWFSDGCRAARSLARRRQAPAGRGAQQPWLDARTRRAVLAVMRASQRAQRELGPSLAGEADEEGRMAQLKALLGA